MSNIVSDRIKPTLLMAPPTYFGVEYVINPWMANQIGHVNREIAQKQWTYFYEKLSQYATVLLLDPAPKLPDIVFTANAGLVLGDRVILSHFRYLERQGEESLNRTFFEKQQLKVLHVPSDLYFEGEGDALLQPELNLLWFGSGFRSDTKVVDFLKAVVDVVVVPLQLADQRFYHLDTCFCPLDAGYVMYFPEAFNATSRAQIDVHVPKEKQIQVSEEDALNFCCNAVPIVIKMSETQMQKVILLNNPSNTLTQQLQQLGYKVIPIPMSEFIKSGGATKCLCLWCERILVC